MRAMANRQTAESVFSSKDDVKKIELKWKLVVADKQYTIQIF